MVVSRESFLLGGLGTHQSSYSTSLSQLLLASQSTYTNLVGETASQKRHLACRFCNQWIFSLDKH